MIEEELPQKRKRGRPITRKKPYRKFEPAEDEAEDLDIVDVPQPEEEFDDTPVSEELEYEVVREKIVHLRAKGKSVRDIARITGKSKRRIYEIIEDAAANIDKLQTSKEENRLCALVRNERLIQKFFRIASAPRLRKKKFTRDGIGYWDDDALELQMEAAKYVLQLEERRAKLLGYNEPEEEKDKGKASSIEQITQFLASQAAKLIHASTEQQPDQGSAMNRISKMVEIE